MRLAIAVTQEAIRTTTDSQEGLDWNQYSAHQAGPELMLMLTRGIMRVKPDIVLISVDGDKRTRHNPKTSNG